MADQVKAALKNRKFLQQLETNPRGWGDRPPIAPPEGEMRSANSRFGDDVAQALNSPLLGEAASNFDDAMTKGAHVGAELTGVPHIVRTGLSLGDAAAEPTPGNVGRAAMNTGLTALMLGGGGGATEVAGTRLGQLADKVLGNKAATGATVAGAGLVGGTDDAKAATWGDVGQGFSNAAKSVGDWISGNDPYAPMPREQYYKEHAVAKPKSLDDAVAAARDTVQKSDAYKALPAAYKNARAKMEADAEASARASYGTMAGDADKAESKLPGQYDSYVSDLNKQRDAFNAKPFYDRNPAAKTITGALTTAVPLAIGARAGNAIGREGIGLVDAAKTARANGDLIGEALALRKLQSFGGDATMTAGKAVAKGAVVPPALRAVGDAYDNTFMAPGTGAHDEAAKKFTMKGLPDYLAGQIPSAIEGAEMTGGMGMGALAFKHPSWTDVKGELSFLKGIKPEGAQPTRTGVMGTLFGDGTPNASSMSPDEVAVALGARRQKALDANAKIRPQIAEDAQGAADVRSAQLDAAHSVELQRLKNQNELGKGISEPAAELGSTPGQSPQIQHLKPEASPSETPAITGPQGNNLPAEVQQGSFGQNQRALPPPTDEPFIAPGSTFNAPKPIDVPTPVAPPPVPMTDLEALKLRQTMRNEPKAADPVDPVKEPIKNSAREDLSSPDGEWMKHWSGPAREYAGSILDGGGAITRGRNGNMTGKRLSEEIGNRTTSVPGVSTATMRVKQLTDDIGLMRKKDGSLSEADAFKKLTADPNYTRFAVPLAAGGFAASQTPDEASAQPMTEALDRRLALARAVMASGAR